MKKIFTFLVLNAVLLVFAQAPANYYSTINTQTGAALKTALHNIIKNHNDQGYNGLWNGYLTTDRDYYFENDGSVLDLYSENPIGTDSYNFIPNVGQCGSYSSEGDCYNREHIIPQSLFGSAAPMVSDIHFIRPTDGKVNGMRSNYPFGKVGTATWTSLNGSKLGSSVSPGYTGTVFEPIDRFKGDVARMIFYFVTRYQDKMTTFSTGNMLSLDTYPSLQSWQIQLLLQWNAQDMVSAEEIARNNASFTFQGNRNPFIDNPQWANSIWGDPDSTPPTAPTNLSTNNPTSNSIGLSWTAATDNIGVSSYDIYVNGAYNSTVNGTTTTIAGLFSNTTYNFYVIAKDLAGNSSPQSNTTSGTTLVGTNPGTGTELYISEYVEGTSNNKAIEITNPTLSPINLNNYSIQKQSNGSGSWMNNLVLSGTIQPGATYVITNSSATFSCTFTSNLSSAAPIDFNGNDPIGLFKNGTLIDIVGTFNGGTANFAVDTTLRRNTIGPSTIFTASQWDILPVNTCDNLGIANPTVIMATVEVINNSAYFIYPNPVINDEVFMQGNGLDKIKSAAIYTLEGRKILEIENPFKQGNKISLGKLPNGMYILNAGKISKKILVKNN